MLRLFGFHLTSLTYRVLFCLRSCFVNTFPSRQSTCVSLCHACSPCPSVVSRYCMSVHPTSVMPLPAESRTTENHTAPLSPRSRHVADDPGGTAGRPGGGTGTPEGGIPRPAGPRPAARSARGLPPAHLAPNGRLGPRPRSRSCLVGRRGGEYVECVVRSACVAHVCWLLGCFVKHWC